jgi:hypothetical protein
MFIGLPIRQSNIAIENAPFVSFIDDFIEFPIHMPI